MRVKRYVVDSMPDALQKIRSDLGKDAVILNTKEIRSGGFLGLFSKKKIEVIAATDSGSAGGTAQTSAAGGAFAKAFSQAAATVSRPQAVAAYGSGAAAGTAVAEPAARTVEPYPKPAASVAPFGDRGQPPVEPNSGSTARPPASPSPGAASAARGSSAAHRDREQAEDSLLAEIRSMKEMMSRLSALQLGEEALPEPLEKLRVRLIDQEVEPELARKLVDQAFAAGRESEGTEWTDEAAKRLVREQLRAILEGEGRKSIDAGTRIAHFVGPTGVGKTTTIAKLAAEQVLKYNRKVAFITSDTYRIAAVEQLKTYATILNIPLEVVFSPQELTRAFAQLEDRDIIFMDTAGRNYRNQMYVSELNSLLQARGQSETFLVLSLTAKYKDMLEITRNFSKFHIDKVLFTKRDETYSYGAIVNLLYDFPIRLSYVTNGQNVPDDIAEASEERIIDLILEGDSHE